MKIRYLIAGIIFSLLMLFTFTPWYSELEFWCYDTLAGHLSRTVSDSVVLIAVTRDDLEALQSYPIADDYWALLIEGLDRVQAGQVIMDMFFPPRKADDWDILGLTLARTRIPVIFSVPCEWVEQNNPLPYQQWVKYGYSNIDLSVDGYARSLPSRGPCSLPALYQVALDLPDQSQAASCLLIPPYPFIEDYRHYTLNEALNLLNQPESSDAFSHKRVFVGYHVPGIAPFFQSPASDQVCSGLNLQANYVNAILTGSRIVRPEFSIQRLWLFFWWILLSLGVLFLTRKRSIISFLSISFLFTLMMLIVLWTMGVYLPLLFPMIGGIFLYIMLGFTVAFEREKELRTRLTSQNHIIEQIIANLPGLAALMNEEGVIIYRNGREGVGIRREEIDDRYWRTIFAGKESEIWWQQKVNGRDYRMMLIRLSGLKDFCGQTRVLLLSYDITENLELESKLKQQEHLASLGRMAANVAHEIRNPLAGMELTAASIREKVSDRPEVTAYVNNMALALNSLNRFVSEFLKFSRSFQLNPIYCDLIPIITEALDQIDREGKPITIERNEPELLMLSADCDRLRQVMINLLQNSVQAIRNNGEIRIEARQIEDRAVITLADNGEGIDPEDLEKVMEPFFTTRARGIGLGLSICRQLIEAHDGQLQIVSQRNLGTKVTITLPIGSEL